MLQIAVVGEENGHFRAVTRLVDAVLLDACEWLDGILPHSRAWCGLHLGEHWYKYNPDDARDLRPVEIHGRRIGAHGYINGSPLKSEAAMWRRVLLLFAHRTPRPDAIILARDLDGAPERLDGIEQVTQGLPWPFPILIAAAQPEIEAWYISGFKPLIHEQSRLRDCKTSLSFDPTLHSERLTSHPNDANTDAKRVLGILCGGDPERIQECLHDRTLLRVRGVGNGAQRFLHDIELRLVPLFR